MAGIAIFLPAHFHFDTFHRYILHLCTVDPLRGETEKNISIQHLRLYLISLLFSYIAAFELFSGIPAPLKFRTIRSTDTRIEIFQNAIIIHSHIVIIVFWKILSIFFVFLHFLVANRMPTCQRYDQ